MNFHLDEIRWFVYGLAGLVLIGSAMGLYFFVRGWEEIKTIISDIRNGKEEH